MISSINHATAIRAYEKVIKVRSFGPPRYKDLKPDVEKEKSKDEPNDHRGQIIDVLV